MGAGNIIGFHLWYRSLPSSTVPVLLHNSSRFALFALTFLIKAIYHVLYAFRYLLLLGLALLALRAILQDHAASHQAAAEKVKAALQIHAKSVDQTIVKHGKTVTRAIEEHTFFFNYSVRNEIYTIEAASNNITASHYEGRNQVEHASIATSNEIRSAVTRITQDMDKHATTAQYAAGSINRQIAYHDQTVKNAAGTIV